ncbi:phosphopantetheine-binding protein [Nocardia sp. NPDC005998]|uniref:acyl carrier protein n=1 Tax=Nocardia sp. NPDC005998 TaxID=3156894 RepID=UPI0033A5E5FE
MSTQAGTPATAVEARVRAIVGEVLWVAADDIDSAAQLIDYGLDSPTAIELTIQLEQAFGISIPEDAAAQLNTVGEIVQYVRGEQ